jgi:hypothetical protein
MPLPEEVPQPEVFCSSSVHDVSVHATWMITFLHEPGEMPFCSSCHFLFKRTNDIQSDRRIPVALLTVKLPSNLSVHELNQEIQHSIQKARMRGYWSEDCLYSIVNTDGAVVITFRRTGPVPS